MTIASFIQTIFGGAPVARPETSLPAGGMGGGVAPLASGNATPKATAPAITTTFQPSMVTGGTMPQQSTHLVNAPKAISNVNAGYTQENPHSISQGGVAGPNAAKVLATEIPAGHLPLATQLGGGNPGLPEIGSLAYQDLVNRGLIKQGQ